MKSRFWTYFGLQLVFFTILSTAQFGGRNRFKSCNRGQKCVKFSLCPEVAKEIDPQNPFGNSNLICGVETQTPLVCCSSPVDETRPVAVATNQSLLPKQGLCGRSQIQTRIIGGSQVRHGEFPWITALGYSETGKSGHDFLCAGSLINSKYVLTAANCVSPKTLRKKKLAVVHLGDWNLESAGRDCLIGRVGASCNPLHIVAGIERVHIHPEYDERSSISDDIALIRLNITVDFDGTSAFVEPVCLPDEDFDVESLVGRKTGIVAGWGLTESGRKTSILRKVRLPIIGDDLCKEKYPSFLPKDQLCVGGEEGKDTCTGDSGAPLIISGDHGPLYTQIGVVSYGSFPCGLKGFPGVYTSVKQYVPWIKKNLRP